MEKHVARNAMGRPAHVLTFEDAVDVWLKRWEGWLQSRIAAHHDTNIGRISEVLNEKRHLGSREEAERRRNGSAPML